MSYKATKYFSSEFGSYAEGAILPDLPEEAVEHLKGAGVIAEVKEPEAKPKSDKPATS